MRSKFMQRLLWCLGIISLLTSCAETKSNAAQETLLIAAGRGKLLFARRVIYAVDIMGKIVNVKVPDGMDYEPEWSPDGLWITYGKSIGTPGDTDIFLLKADGQSKPIQLTNGPFHDAMSPRWSPDGSRIAYNDYSGNSNKIYLLDMGCMLQGQSCSVSPRVLFIGDSPSWSPDGKKIVYHDPSRADVLVGDVSVPTNTPLVISKNLYSCGSPEWSPLGAKIAFVCDQGIYTIDPDGKNLAKIASDGLFLKWSPDGKQIIFVGGKISDPNLGQSLDIEGMIGSTAIFIMDSDGKNIRRLTPYNDESIGWFAWVPRK